MPTGTKFNAIYLGNHSDLEATSGTTGAYSDVDQPYYTNEANAASLLGTYDSSVLQIVEITAYHRAEDGVIGIDSYPSAAYNNGQEGIEYSVSGGNTVGDGVVSSTSTSIGTPPPDYNNGTTGGIAIDNEVYYNATVTYIDGGTGLPVTASKVVAVFQTDNGDVFLQEYLNSNSGSYNLDGLQIQEIELTSIYTYDNDAIVYDGWSITGASIVCFGRGTLIETEKGGVPVESLRVGSLVKTKDHGFQPIRWIGRRGLSSTELRENPQFRPIRIRAGAINKKSPARDLIVSPQHRVLLASKIVERMFDAQEVLIAAKHLCEIDGIEVIEDVDEIEYFHFMFERHEIVYSNGAATESLFMGRETIKSFNDEAREELAALFPELGSLGFVQSAARDFASARRGQKLAMRHAKNNKDLVGLGPSQAGSAGGLNEGQSNSQLS